MARRAKPTRRDEAPGQVGGPSPRWSLIIGGIGATLALLVSPIVVKAVERWFDPVADQVTTAGGGPPLELLVTYHQRLEPANSFDWVLGSDTAIPTTGGDAAVAQFVREQAVPAGRALLAVTMHGVLAEDVVVEDIRVRAERLAAVPPARALMVPPPVGGHPVPRVTLGFDLDAGDERARTLAEKGLGEPYFDRSVLVVKRGEKLAFTIAAYAREGFYRWNVDVRVEAGGKVHVLTVPVAEELLVSGYAKSYPAGYVWQDDGSITAATSAEVCGGDCRDRAEGGPRAS
jgi:hypothetical protein